MVVTACKMYISLGKEAIICWVSGKVHIKVSLFFGSLVMRLLILCILVYVINYDSMKDIPVPNGMCSSSSGENRRPSLFLNTLSIAISIKIIKTSHNRCFLYSVNKRKGFQSASELYLLTDHSCL